MKIISLAAVIVIGVLFGAAPAAQADTPSVISKITADDLAQMLSKLGFQPFVVNDKGEKVIIPTGFFLAGSPKTEVRLQQCDGEGCSRVLFRNWPNPLHADQGWVTRWNGGPNGLIKAYLQADRTLRFDMTIDLTGGVSPQFIEQSAYAFVTLIDRIWPNSGL